jgi:glycerophosphoryl diester phosphodiesterase
MPAVTALRARGVPVLAWTIRSPNEEAAARAAGAANITFEGYPAAH